MPFFWFVFLRLWNTTVGQTCFFSASSSSLASWGENTRLSVMCACVRGSECVACVCVRVAALRRKPGLDQGLSSECDLSLQVCPDVFHCALHAVQLCFNHHHCRLHQGPPPISRDIPSNNPTAFSRVCLMCVFFRTS